MYNIILEPVKYMLFLRLKTINHDLKIIYHIEMGNLNLWMPGDAILCVNKE